MMVIVWLTMSICVLVMLICIALNYHCTTRWPIYGAGAFFDRWGMCGPPLRISSRRGGRPTSAFYVAETCASGTLYGHEDTF